MNIREEVERWEQKNLSPNATLSIKTRGRARMEDPCPVRTEFQKDRDKILHSLSFRLLKHKTQVFLSTTGEKFRTRLTHTLEVASVARCIANSLKLNQDLVEAIALGHDLGHTPFGHIGEQVLDELTPFEFRHNCQSVRVLERIENSGAGLNLTHEVKQGIMEHSKGDLSIYTIHSRNLSQDNKTSTLEGEVVQFADWIAYINHDIDDAFNMNLITRDDIPKTARGILGYNFEKRFVTMINDVIEASYQKDHIQMSVNVMKATEDLRQFLYNHVYMLPDLIAREKTARTVITGLYNYYLKNYELVIAGMGHLRDEEPNRGTCDFIASLTDKKAQELFEKIK